TLAAPGITVEVTSDPYGYGVRDGTGRVVLRTLDPVGGGGGDGYGALAFTTGDLTFRAVGSSGYTDFTAGLDPWRDRFRVVSVETTAPDRLDVTLAVATGQETGRRVHVSHRLRASALRVEVTVAGDPPRAM